MNYSYSIIDKDNSVIGSGVLKSKDEITLEEAAESVAGEVEELGIAYASIEIDYDEESSPFEYRVDDGPFEIIRSPEGGPTVYLPVDRDGSKLVDYWNEAVDSLNDFRIAVHTDPWSALCGSELERGIYSLYKIRLMHIQVQFYVNDEIPEAEAVSRILSRIENSLLEGERIRTGGPITREMHERAHRDAATSLRFHLKRAYPVSKKSSPKS